MVRNDVIWVWVRIVANGVARAVVNGSEPSRMVRTVAIGFGFRSLRMVMLELSRMVQTVVNGSDRREWLSATVWELSATVRLDGNWVWE